MGLIAADEYGRWRVEGFDGEVLEVAVHCGPPEVMAGVDAAGAAECYSGRRDRVVLQTGTVLDGLRLLSTAIMDTVSALGV